MLWLSPPASLSEGVGSSGSVELIPKSVFLGVCLIGVIVID